MSNWGWDLPKVTQGTSGSTGQKEPDSPDSDSLFSDPVSRDLIRFFCSNFVIKELEFEILIFCAGIFQNMISIISGVNHLGQLILAKLCGLEV